MEFVSFLTQELEANISAQNAVPMAKYMKNLFPFLGIKSGFRKEIYKNAAMHYKDELKVSFKAIATNLFNEPCREYHYCAIDMLIKFWPKNFVKADVTLIEYFLSTKSWWDSVDPLAKYILGGYLNQFPEETENVINRFAKSSNMWLNRAAIIHQLGYKKETNAALLYALCEHFSSSKEFFIQKAIGWALREYAKVNPESVTLFVSSTALKPLSVREALKNI